MTPVRFAVHSKNLLPAPPRLAALCAGLALCLAGCSAEPVELRGKTMGTTYSVKVDRLPRGLDAKTLQSEIDARLEAVNDQMSTWREGSELSRFNRHEGADWFPVSAATAKVAAAALEISEKSGGAFDVTVMPLVDLWSFGPAGRTERVPSDEQLSAARGHVGWKKLHVRADPPALRKEDPRLRVDLSAIAKGYGVDVVAEHLEERGVAGYMVEIGGEVRCRGKKADGSGWRIGIEAPLDDVRQLHGAVTLVDRSLATSGGYRNFFMKDGRRYSHTIDPRTGRPIEHRLASVSIVADDCTTADALATTLMVLGPDEGYNWAVEHEIAALLLMGDGDEFTEKATPAFDRLARDTTP